jgi:hypothetical protein
MKKLITHQEEEELRQLEERKYEPFVSPNLGSEMLMHMEPRVDPEVNYNFEEHRVYTKVLKKALEVDAKETMEKRKILKYIKQNPNNLISNSWMKKLGVDIENVMKLDEK